MRSRILTNHLFLQGVVAGFAIAGVALLTFGARKRLAQLRSDRDVARFADRTVIDGARAINPVDLDLQSPPETRSKDRPLESEGPDPALVTQRW